MAPLRPCRDRIWLTPPKHARLRTALNRVDMRLACASAKKFFLQGNFEYLQLSKSSPTSWAHSYWLSHRKKSMALLSYLVFRFVSLGKEMKQFSLVQMSLTHTSKKVVFVEITSSRYIMMAQHHARSFSKESLTRRHDWESWTLLLTSRQLKIGHGATTG